MLSKISFFNSGEPFHFVCGKSIPDLRISYETWGELNADGSNAILICHYFSGHKHAAGRYTENDAEAGWWDALIGPGKAFDTNKYFVVATDSLSCLVRLDGVESSGPRSINPATGKPWGRDFPVTTIEDMVNAQKILLDALGVKKLVAVSGPSMGGLQALQWAASYPDFVQKIIPVAAAPEIDGFTMIFPLRMGMEAINHDPESGLKIAIMALALIARGRNWMDTLMGGRLFDPQKPPVQEIDNYFLCEKNLLEEIERRSALCDPISYVYISKANMLFNLYEWAGGADKLFDLLQGEFLVIAEQNDLFIPAQTARTFYERLRERNIRADYYEFSSPIGHLGSVGSAVMFADAIRNFLLK